MTPLERVDHAIDRIQAKGWTQGMLRRGNVDGPGCLLGSLLTDDEWQIQMDTGATLSAAGVMIHELQPVARAMGFSSIGEVPQWNDTLTRFKAVSTQPRFVPISSEESAFSSTCMNYQIVEDHEAKTQVVLGRLTIAQKKLQAQQDALVAEQRGAEAMRACFGPAEIEKDEVHAHAVA